MELIKAWIFALESDSCGYYNYKILFGPHIANNKKNLISSTVNCYTATSRPIIIIYEDQWRLEKSPCGLRCGLTPLARSNGHTHTQQLTNNN